MKLILALTFTCALAFGQDAPSEALLRAEIDHLKAQLAVAVQQLEIASLPQVMRTRLAAAEAAEKLKALQSATQPVAAPASAESEKQSPSR